LGFYDLKLLQESDLKSISKALKLEDDAAKKF